MKKWKTEPVPFVWKALHKHPDYDHALYHTRHFCRHRKFVRPCINFQLGLVLYRTKHPIHRQQCRKETGTPILCGPGNSDDCNCLLLFHGSASNHPEIKKAASAAFLLFFFQGICIFHFALNDKENIVRFIRPHTVLFSFLHDVFYNFIQVNVNIAFLIRFSV